MRTCEQHEEEDAGRRGREGTGEDGRREAVSQVGGQVQCHMQGHLRVQF